MNINRCEFVNVMKISISRDSYLISGFMLCLILTSLSLQPREEKHQSLAGAAGTISDQKSMNQLSGSRQMP